MDIKPVRTKADHRAAVERVLALGKAYNGLSKASKDEYRVLSDLIFAYEARQPPRFDRPTAREAIAYALETMGLERKDVYDLFGGRSHLSSILNGHEGIPNSRLLDISERLHISLETLLNTGKLTKRKNAGAKRSRAQTSSPA